MNMIYVSEFATLEKKPNFFQTKIGLSQNFIIIQRNFSSGGDDKGTFLSPSLLSDRATHAHASHGWELRQAH